MNKKILLPLLCWMTSISAQGNTIITPENETMEQPSTYDPSLDIQRGNQITEQQPEIETPDTFTPTEELIEDLSYEFPIDI